MGKKIVVTGYFGSGSSAVLDLLREYSCNGSVVQNTPGGYEHIMLYYPGGLFDLEDKLLLANDMQRSDEALSTFIRAMNHLNSKNFGWFGSYRHLFGDTFKKAIAEFVQNLHPISINSRYYGQYRNVIFNPFKIPIQVMAMLLTGRTIYKWGRQFIYDNGRTNMTVCFPTEQEYYLAARKFIGTYLDLFNQDGKENTIFDRLLLCQNLYRIPNYFDDDLRVIRVGRDIRDLYVLGNYVWKKINAGTMYPKGIEDFVFYWKHLVANEKNILDDRILNISFEDLIYNYDETVKKIEEHCGLSKDQHNQKLHFFNPQKSIMNTQVYKMNAEWESEIKVLESEFPQYTYDFPYEITTDVNMMFDDSSAKHVIPFSKR